MHDMVSEANVKQLGPEGPAGPEEAINAGEAGAMGDKSDRETVRFWCWCIWCRRGHKARYPGWVEPYRIGRGGLSGRRVAGLAFAACLAGSAPGGRKTSGTRRALVEWKGPRRPATTNPMN